MTSPFIEPAYLDSNGNLNTLFPTSPSGATIFANAWLLQVTDDSGNAIQGNFSVTETVNTAGPNNLDHPLQNFQYTWTTNFNGQFVDNIMLSPANLSGNEFSMTQQNFTINGLQSSTVFNQYAIYQPGLGLVAGNPWPAP